MRLEISRLWRLIGGDAQSCRVQLDGVGCWLGADRVAKRCRRVIAMTRGPCEERGDVTRANVRSWAALPQSRRSVRISGNRGVHVCSRCVGGARIGALRANTSMTIIGAPQWRQTKAGRVAMVVSRDGAMPGATCSSSRTLARLARRTGLASSP